MEKYLTICQNRISFDLGRLCGAEATESEWGEWEVTDKIQGKYVYVLGEPWSVADLRVFDGFMLEAAVDNDEVLFLSAADFAELCGISRQAASLQFDHGVLALNSVFAARDAPLFRCEKVRGGLQLALLPPFLEAAEGKKTRGVMPFPSELFRVSMRGNSRTYLLGRTLAFLKFMTYGKTNEDILSGRAILPVLCPTGQCTEYKKLCLEPFYRSMKELNDILDFCWSEDEPKNLRQFSRCRLCVIWKDYPDSGYLALRKKNPSEEE